MSHQAKECYVCDVCVTKSMHCADCKWRRLPFINSFTQFRQCATCLVAGCPMSGSGSVSHLYSAISFHADGHMLAALHEEVGGGGGTGKREMQITDVNVAVGVTRSDF